MTSRALLLAFRAVLFLVATFGFIVLFDHGPHDFPRHAAEDFRALVAWAAGGFRR